MVNERVTRGVESSARRWRKHLEYSTVSTARWRRNLCTIPGAITLQPVRDDNLDDTAPHTLKKDQGE